MLAVMPPRPRRDRQPDAAPIAPADAAADVARFADLVRAQRKREQAKQADDRRRVADDRRKAEEAQAESRRHADAGDAKELAARQLKQVRARGSNAAVAEAEAAYKQALADLLAIEQGERPAWAPAPPEPEAAEPEPAELEGAEPSSHESAATDASAPDEPSSDEPTPEAVDAAD